MRYWIDVFTSVHILICWSVSKFAFQYTVFADEYYLIYFLYYFSISIMDEITSLISILLLCCEKGAEIGLSKWKYIVGVRTDQTAVPLIPYRCNIKKFHLKFLLFNLDRGIISRHFDFDSTMCKNIKGKCRWYIWGRLEKKPDTLSTLWDSVFIPGVPQNFAEDFCVQG